MARLSWEPATVVAIMDETRTAKTFRLRLGHPSAHLASHRPRWLFGVAVLFGGFATRWFAGDRAHD
jgi:hypothetical protein